MCETYQRFVEASFKESSTNGGPTGQQMAALAVYSYAAMLTQKETKFFTPTIYSQIASIVMTQRYPALYYNNHFYPREDPTANRNTGNDVDGSIDESDEDTKDFDTSSSSDDTLDIQETSFKSTSKSSAKPSNKRSSIIEQEPSSSPPTTRGEGKQRGKRERKPPQRYEPENTIKIVDEEKAAAAEVADCNHEDKEASSNDEEDEDGPPVLQRIDDVPLKLSHKSGKKNELFIKTKTSSSDGFKHPKKAINFDKAEIPQLVPNAPFKVQEDSDPTEPLEEWFLANLTNPFPTVKEFSHLQYLSNFGHLDIRQWFASRRKVFCKQNPKSRPWASNKKSAPAKRLSSSSNEEEKRGKNLMEDEMVTKKLKTIKIEVSELEVYS